MSLTEQELKMLDQAVADHGPSQEEKPKPKRKAKQANEPPEVENDVEQALVQGEADDIEARLPTHNEEGKKLSPRERRIAYLNQLTHGQIRGISKLSVAKLDAKIQEIEAAAFAEEEPQEEGEEQALEEVPQEEEAPVFSIEEIRDGAKFCAQLAAQGLLGIEKLTHSTASTTGVDCTGAYGIYNSNPMFQQHAEKGWEKLLSDNPKLVRKILGPWFYLGNAYATPCALAAAANLREARIKAMKE